MRFNLDEYVGVKWNWNRGLRESQRLTTGDLCAERLSRTTWIADLEAALGSA